MNERITEIPVKRIDGTQTNLGEAGGTVSLVVNVASQCGLTPQYAGLESLYERYRDRGFVVLGFPANEFGAQEPGTNEEIAQFCETQFAVQFPLFEKIVVKGPGQHPLYKALTQAQPKATEKPDGTLKARLEERGRISPDRGADEILWNFEKFVVDRNGDVVARFAPDVTPDDPMLIDVIEAELAKA